MRWRRSSGPSSALNGAQIERATDVTYLGAVYGTLSALRRMRARDHGVIVQVGSALAYRAIPLQAPYCAAKHALRGFTDALRCELLHDGSNVRVTMVHLSAFNTPQFDWALNLVGKRPMPVPPIFQPELAARAIVWAARGTRREAFVGWPAVKAVTANKLFPGLLDRMLAEQGYSGQITEEPLPRQACPNLYDPAIRMPVRMDGSIARRARGARNGGSRRTVHLRRRAMQCWAPCWSPHSPGSEPSCPTESSTSAQGVVHRHRRSCLASSLARSRVRSAVVRRLQHRRHQAAFLGSPIEFSSWVCAIPLKADADEIEPPISSGSRASRSDTHAIERIACSVMALRVLRANRSGRGQLPSPSSLSQSAREWPAAHLFYITQKGVRMSGMPAWEFRIAEEAHLVDRRVSEEDAASMNRADYEALAATSTTAQCPRPSERQPYSVERAQMMLRQYACDNCHRHRRAWSDLRPISGRRSNAGASQVHRRRAAEHPREPGAMDRRSAGVSPHTLMPEHGGDASACAGHGALSLQTER